MMDHGLELLKIFKKPNYHNSLFGLVIRQENRNQLVVKRENEIFLNGLH